MSEPARRLSIAGTTAQADAAPAQAETTASALFLSHFSEKASSGQTEIYFQSQIEALHPDQKVLVSQEFQFDLVKFGKESTNDAQVTRNVQGEMVHNRFLPASNRRDGVGSLSESGRFVSFEVLWRGEQIRVYSLTWMEGRNQIKKQQHIVSSSLDLSRRLLLAVCIFSSTTPDSILVFDQSHWASSPALFDSVHKSSWSDVILDPTLKQRLANEFPAFLESKKTYKDLGIPWKRGVIFRGPAGNGKTVTIKAILHSATVPVLYVKSFHAHGDDERGIKDIFSRAREEAPCILVLEDLDSLITTTNRAFFLNELDGLEDNDGLFLIGTTNHFEKLDPAISNRPSRFDRKYDFPNPSESERQSYSRYWRTKLRNHNAAIDLSDKLIEIVASRTDGFSFAVSSLVSLANASTTDRSTNSDLSDIVLEQIEWLRKQLDADIPLTGPVSLDPQAHSMGGEPVFGNMARSLWGDVQRARSINDMPPM